MTLEFQFNIGIFISFLIGFGFGIAICVLLYLVVVLSSMSDKKLHVIKSNKEVKKEKIFKIM